MISLILRVVAFLLFVAAGLGQTLLEQPPVELIAWGLGCWVLATLLGNPIVVARTRAGRQ